MSGFEVRLAGAPQSQPGLSREAVLEGLREENWDVTDEVRGPGETEWQTLEAHPAFAETIAEIEPPPAKPHDDETRLDMNPLIDVALVLLIFFILTTTYEELRKVLPSPPPAPEETKGVTTTEKELNNFTIRISAIMEAGQPVIRIKDVIVEEASLQDRLERAVSETGFKKIAVEVDPAVPWKTFIAIQDAATGAKIEETIRITRKK